MWCQWLVLNEIRCVMHVGDYVSHFRDRRVIGIGNNNELMRAVRSSVAEEKVHAGAEVWILHSEGLESVISYVDISWELSCPRLCLREIHVSLSITFSICLLARFITSVRTMQIRFWYCNNRLPNYCAPGSGLDWPEVRSHCGRNEQGGPGWHKR